MRTRQQTKKAVAHVRLSGGRTGNPRQGMEAQGAEMGALVLGNDYRILKEAT
ncbi:hypothetical protein [Anaerobaca lacustris]|uniref:Resolvase/invertase-type recombinase catalytic domain-containing protein n=1 Tax=Anaerobaca lacustris TaxID=3044600 RepID=A0AAW6U0Q9_9BACT|nr:hypothetical protein [Sedimentisphaerales bacterium M17dextr]